MLADRFWSKVEFSEECWFWRGCIVGGYGQFADGLIGKRVYAHRWAYEFCIEPIPEGLTIDHLCRNRACVNPAHLEAVSLRENQRRAEPFRIHPSCCPKGHSYSPDNNYRRSDGYTECRICRRENQRRRRTIFGNQEAIA